MPPTPMFIIVIDLHLWHDPTYRDKLKIEMTRILLEHPGMKLWISLLSDDLIDLFDHFKHNIVGVSFTTLETVKDIKRQIHNDFGL